MWKDGQRVTAISTRTASQGHPSVACVVLQTTRPRAPADPATTAATRTRPVEPSGSLGGGVSSPASGGEQASFAGGFSLVGEPTSGYLLSTDHLLGHPLRVWVGGAVGVEQPPGAEFDDDDHVKRLQKYGLDREEVGSDDRRSVGNDASATHLEARDSPTEGAPVRLPRGFGSRQAAFVPDRIDGSTTGVRHSRWALPSALASDWWRCVARPNALLGRRA